MDKFWSRVIFFLVWIGLGYVSLIMYHKIKIKLLKWESKPIKIGSILWKVRGWYQWRLVKNVINRRKF